MFVTESTLYLTAKPLLILAVPFLYALLLIFFAPQERKRLVAFISLLFFIVCGVFIRLYTIGSYNGSFSFGDLLSTLAVYGFLSIFSLHSVYISGTLAGAGILTVFLVGYQFFQSNNLVRSPLALVDFIKPAGVLVVVILLYSVGLILVVSQISRVTLPDFSTIAMKLLPPQEYTATQEAEVTASTEFKKYIANHFPITSQIGSGPVSTYRTPDEYRAAFSTENWTHFVHGYFLEYFLWSRPPLTQTQQIDIARLKTKYLAEHEKGTEKLFEETRDFFRKYGINASTERQTFLSGLMGFGGDQQVGNFVRKSGECKDKTVLFIVPACTYFFPDQTVIFES